MMEPEGTIDPRRSAALSFWRGFAKGDEEAYRNALELLTEVMGEDLSAYNVGATSSSDSSGKFVAIEMPLSSPKSAQDAWASDKKTTLCRVIPEYHCLAYHGDIRDYDGGNFFVACAAPGGISREAGACTIGTHTNEDRARIVVDGPAYFVKVKSSNLATKPKVLSGVYVLESDIPTMLLEYSGSDLLDLKATPQVWRIVLSNYPGLETMENWTKSDIKAPEEEDVSVLSQSPLFADAVSSPSGLGPQDVKQLDQAMTTVFEVEEIGSAGLEQRPNWRQMFDEGISLQPGTAGSVSSSPSHFGGDPTNEFGDRGYYPSWKAPVKKLERDLAMAKLETSAKFRALDNSLDEAFSGARAEMLNQVATVRQNIQVPGGNLETVLERLAVMEAEVKRLSRTPLGGGLPQGADLRVDTMSTPRTKNSVPTFDWDQLSSEAQQGLVTEVVKHLDMTALGRAIEGEFHLSSMNSKVNDVESRVTYLEREVSSEHGMVPRIKAELEKMQARGNISASERGGYVFTGQADIQALVQMVGVGKLSVLCLDLVGMLTLAQDPFVTYEGGVQAHANAQKANFGSVLESRLKLSFEIPYPEIIVRRVDSVSTSARGGAKWAPMFDSAEVFEDDFRDGTHRRVLKGIESAYDLTQKAVDQEFPTGAGGAEAANNRKIHTILSDQNRQAYRQTIAFIESLLPFHRTLKGGGLSSADAWERVFVLVVEVLDALREARVISSDLSAESALIWGCFKATDLAEEFRLQKFVEHHKALAILALTSIEREGKSMSSLEDRTDRKVAEATANKAEKSAVTRLDTRVQTLENKLKNIVAKMPELK